MYDYEQSGVDIPEYNYQSRGPWGDISTFRLPSGILLPESNVDCEEILAKDLEYLKDMYPAKAKLILALCEDKCDRLEYEGSPMLTKYPDKEYILRISREIFRSIKNSDEKREKREETYEERAFGRYDGEKESCCSENEDALLKQMIEILVISECAARRSRYFRRKRFF